MSSTWFQYFKILTLTLYLSYNYMKCKKLAEKNWPYFYVNTGEVPHIRKVYTIKPTCLANYLSLKHYLEL